MNHYASVWLQNAQGNDVKADDERYYKYASDTIIPDRTSLLQVDVYPSYGQYDYLEVTANSSYVMFNQLVEGRNENVGVESTGSTTTITKYLNYANYAGITNGIRVTDKISKYKSTIDRLHIFLCL